MTARWTDPKVRKSPLTPYARDAETKTLDLLKDSLRSKGGRAVTAEVQSQLQACAPRDAQELLSHLQTRGEQTTTPMPPKAV